MQEKPDCSLCSVTWIRGVKYILVIKEPLGVLLVFGKDGALIFSL